MDQSKMPLYEKLVEHQTKDPHSFHVPGHKGGLLLKEMNPVFSSLMKYDLTELSGLDDLHDASGVIEEAQILLSALYETRKSYFLVNGSTVGNLAMILAVCKEGDVRF